MIVSSSSILQLRYALADSLWRISPITVGQTCLELEAPSLHVDRLRNSYICQDRLKARIRADVSGYGSQTEDL